MNTSDECLRSYATVYFTHLSILCAGYMLGLFVAYLFTYMPMDFSSDLIKAKELGIVSVSILKGYPKSKDFVLFFVLITLPFFCAVTPWYFWARNRMNVLHDVLNPPATQYDHGFCVYTIIGVLLAMFVLLTFDINIFSMSGHNPVVGSWIFLGEEGAPLAWAQSILSGGTYGKDFYCLYGPLMPYSLAGAMKLFGQTVVVERGLKYFFDLVAFGSMAYFLVKTIRSRYVIVLACLLYILFYIPAFIVTINFTTLRFVLGVMPLLLVHLYSDQEKPKIMLGAGMIAGTSILFSQEAGMVSLAVCLFIFILEDVVLQLNAKRFFVKTALLLSGMIIVTMPMVCYLAVKSDLSMLWDSIYGFPKLKTLGYGSYPFPSLQAFITDPLNSVSLIYWMIFYYVGLAVYLFVQLATKSDDKTALLKLSLVLYGIILLRIPLGRTGVIEAIKVFHPVLLLLAFHMDALISSMVNSKVSYLKVGHALMAFVVFGTLSITAAFGSDANLRRRMGHLMYSITNPSKRLTIQPTGVSLTEIERGGIFYSRETADSITKIKTFLDANAQKDRYVYFFPNEAAYYFIFNKQNPTRYAIAYFAATKSQQLELIADLERNRPRYVVYSPKTWRVDYIPEMEQVPEVFGYLQRTYGVVSDLGNVVILQRQGF